LLNLSGASVELFSALLSLGYRCPSFALELDRSVRPQPRERRLWINDAPTGRPVKDAHASLEQLRPKGNDKRAELRTIWIALQDVRLPLPS
jgi:hypothetical protein